MQTGRRDSDGYFFDTNLIITGNYFMFIWFANVGNAQGIEISPTFNTAVSVRSMGVF